MVWERRRWGLALVASLAWGCGGAGDGQGNAGKAPPPAFVDVLRTEPETVRDIVKLVGQLEPEESVVLKPETSGVIEGHDFDEGDAVRKGQILFRLRDERQSAAVREAEAQERLAADTHRRREELARGGITSEAELVRAARELDVARAAAERARVDLEKTRIRAPFDGFTGARLVSPGDRVDSETNLVTITAMDRLKVAFMLPEIAVPLANRKLPLDVKTADQPGQKFPGEVYFVAPGVDPSTRQLLLKAWVDNADHRLRPGSFAEIEVEITRRENAIALPDSAIGYEGSSAFVWRVGAENRAERVPVETGIRQGGKIEIRNGIAAGDVIVVSGTNKVFPGAVVQARGAKAEAIAGKPAEPAS